MSSPIVWPEGLSDEDRATLERNGEVLGKKLLSRLPRDLVAIRNLVFGSAGPFYRTPSRQAALSFATALRSAAKRCRKYVAGGVFPTGSEPSWLSLAQALEDQAVVLDEAAILLKDFSEETTPETQKVEIRKTGDKLHVVEKVANGILLGIYELTMKTILPDVLKEAAPPAP